MTTAHPEDEWSRYCPRSPVEPTLVLDGRRSIFAAWPPSATCEVCGEGPVAGAGYVGPVSGDSVTYPDPTTRFVCRTCARTGIGLGDHDWTGHQCRPECRDTLHVDWVALPEGDLTDSTPKARVERFADEYATRGWTVTAVEIEPKAPAVIGGRYWTVFFQPTRPRW